MTRPNMPQSTPKTASKMQRLPKGHILYPTLPTNTFTNNLTDYKVEKRPLLRPPITSQYASSQHPKTIYISTKTPFMSAVKRVQKLLLQAEKRSAQSASDQVSSRPKYSASSNDEITDIERVASIMAAEKYDRDEIILKATGKAIAKALSLGLWFDEKVEYAVRIETGTVGAIDDIVAPEDGDQTMKEDGDKTIKEDGEEEIPESRIRYASTIQIFVSAAS
jgi:ribonuclease P/MRP protein subunit POP7